MARTNGADRRARARRRGERRREPGARGAPGDGPRGGVALDAEQVGTAHAALDALEAKLAAVSSALDDVSRGVDALAHRLDVELDAGPSDPSKWRHRTRRRVT